MVISSMETDEETPKNSERSVNCETESLFENQQTANLSNDQSTTTTTNTGFARNFSTTTATVTEKVQDVSLVEDAEKFFDAPQSHTGDTPAINFPGRECETSKNNATVLPVAAPDNAMRVTPLKEQRFTISPSETPQELENVTKEVEIIKQQQQQQQPLLTTVGKQRQRTFKLGINPTHVKELLMMQLDLIGHQQLKIMEKDKQIISLQSEKEQLEAKLSRMERRISIQRRHHLEMSASQEDSGGSVSSLATRSRVNALPLLKSPLVVSSNVGKKLENENKSIAVDKNTLPVTVTSCNDKGFCFENFLRTNVTYLDPPIKKRLCIKDKVKAEKVERSHVPVPPWRVIEPTKSFECNEDDLENVEDTSDVAYDKRHSKPEQEEKRRKRWDLQQARQQRQHEMLVQKYMERQKGKLQGCTGDFLSPSKSKQNNNKDNNSISNTIETLVKEGDSVYAVEVTEIVPVCAFGYPLPSLAPRELELPWFNIAKREVQLRTAREKLVTRSKKKAIMTQKKRRSCRT